MPDIKSFKEREVNLLKPVKVYRCLNRTGVVFSVWQEGKVIGHTSNLALSDVQFKISKAGQKRARETQQRNVHAFAVGFISDKEWQNKKGRVSYNPFLNDFFYLEDSSKIEHAEQVVFTNDGLFLI